MPSTTSLLDVSYMLLAILFMKSIHALPIYVLQSGCRVNVAKGDINDYIIYPRKGKFRSNNSICRCCPHPNNGRYEAFSCLLTGC